MRKTLILSATLLVAAAVAAGAQTAQPAKPAQKPAAPAAQPAQAPAAPSAAGKPESPEDRFCYAIGMNLGRSLKANEVPVNMDLLIKGLRDAVGGGPALLTDEEMQAAVQTVQQKVMAQQEAKRKSEGEKNKLEGEAFLAKNKERPGVKTTASGLQYEVVKEGTGPSPKATDTVTVNYTGTLRNGTKFDSSVDRGQPATFVLNQVIPGWTEGVQLMKVGGKYKFYIPAALGYGERGAGNVIGPNEPLIFEVDLLSIGQPEPPKPADGQAQPQKPPAEGQSQQKPPA